MLWWFRGFTFKDKNIIFINHQQYSCMIVWRKLRGFWEKSAEKHQALMALQMIGWILNNNWPAATHPDVHSDQNIHTWFRKYCHLKLLKTYNNVKRFMYSNIHFFVSFLFLFITVKSYFYKPFTTKLSFLHLKWTVTLWLYVSVW